EQSGHIVLSDYSTTGDGLLAALQLLAVIVREQKPASEVCRVFQPMPQLLRSVGINGRDPLGDGAVKKAIQDGEGRLAKDGRLLIRTSGTEPLIRIMAEGEDEALVGAVVEDIAQVIEHAGR
ncbi:MAG: phosphoglucosamine mutase, partial [Rhodospirillales bacterium]|nr:phosphoglucosamine mutase [Rhodospirillales bacterium]